MSLLLIKKDIPRTILVPLCLLAGFFALIADTRAADEAKLHGRWRILSDASVSGIHFLQFEAGNRVFVEGGEEEHKLVTYVKQYRLEETKLYIGEEYDEESFDIDFQGGSLALSTGGGSPQYFTRERNLRSYPAIAQDPESRLLDIEALDLNVEIFGDRVITHAFYTIKNNFDEELEAKINIPLPDDALVVGYALDIGEQMIPGVAVPKEKARETFEAIEDRKVDPGLAEITRGNQFSTEIYPVPEKGRRKIRVSYSHSLDRGLTGALTYRFPYSDYDSQAAYSLTMSADGMRFPPTVKKSPFSRRDWDEANTGQRFYYAEALLADRDRIQGLDDLEVRFVPAKGSTAMISRSADGYRYTYAKLDIEDAMLQNLDAPERVSILWDASASAKDDHKQKLSVVKSWISKIKKQKVAELEVQLVIFAHTVLQEEELTLLNGKDSGLIDLLENVDYDGATRFDLPAERVKTYNPDYALLLSDGISTMGSLDAMNIDAPLYTVSFAQTKNLPWLYQSARISGGMYFNAQETGSSRIARLIATRIPDLEMRVNGESKEVDTVLWYEAGNTITVTVAARLPENLSDMAEGTLAFSVNGVMLSVVPFEQRAQGEIARFDWLRLRLNALSGELKKNEAEIQKLGMEYSLVTPYTSLLVLEELDDYVQYGIQPPPNFKGAEKYSALRKVFLDEEEGPPEQAAIVAFLENAWGERRQWWENSTRKNLEEIKNTLNEVQQKSKEQAQGVQESSAPASPDTIVAHDIGAVAEEVSVSGIRASIAGPQATTTLLPWSPDKPYLDVLKAGDPKGKKSRYQLYLEQKQQYAKQATYFMDVAHFFEQQGERELALRILSNVLEAFPENVGLERMVAYNLIQFEALDEAISVLEHVKELNAWEPASFRDLANVWDKKAQQSAELAHYQKAIDYYFKAILGPWALEDPLRVVALMELNHLLAGLKTEALALPEWQSDLLQHFPLELRIVITWNSRVADVDLWVVEPSGQEVYYRQRNSLAGGYLPFDIVDGFGPEEYLSRFALEGDYEIKVNLYSNDSVELFGPLSLTLDIYTHYGMPNEQRQTTTVQLKNEGEAIPIGNVTWQ